MTDAGRTASSDRDRRAWANLCFFGRGLVQDRVRLLEVDPIRFARPRLAGSRFHGCGRGVGQFLFERNGDRKRAMV